MSELHDTRAQMLLLRLLLVLTPQGAAQAGVCLHAEAHTGGAVQAPASAGCPHHVLQAVGTAGEGAVHASCLCMPPPSQLHAQVPSPSCSVGLRACCMPLQLW